ncbi:hypothetical protein I3843_08G137300 [Carya illinoinensis]|nr:hypothetical protein I3843_08G137300 [Carya illinoinensis]
MTRLEVEDEFSSSLDNAHSHQVALLSASSISSQLSAIETLTGNNYVRWKRDIEIALGLLGLDFALEEQPSKPTDKSIAEYVVEYQKWERANRLCLKIIKRQRFIEFDKAEIGDLMDRLMSMKYDGSSGVREYIMKMIHISSKLEALKIPIAEPFLVYHVLNSLPSQFNQLKVAYNAQRDKWDLNDLIVVCAQEECRMRRETVETVQLAFQPQQNKGSSHNHKPKFQKGYKSHRNEHNKRFGGQTSGGSKEIIMNSDQCKFCKKKGHWQKDCFKFKTWLEKKKKKNLTGISLALVCFESSLVDVPLNSWWIDSGASIHIANSLQGFFM